MKHGDFTKLAKNYAMYRPAYAPPVLEAILGLTGKDTKEIDFADVGAGTGIWARMAAAAGCKTRAVEPNEAMRLEGEKQNGSLDILWVDGSAEETGLGDNSADILTMASSFHWADFDVATKEFQRVLRPGGLFMALWNTRITDTNPLLVDIENKLKELVPDMKRVSSGRSEFCDHLFDKLEGASVFDSVLYMEGKHVEYQSPERYIGLWESVNDVRVQAGEERFGQFMDYIKERVNNLEHIEATYLTRAWIGFTTK
ncbi:class I SAM-dependent methyltransferase [Pseudodesulfovibrio sp. zrk46]|uniref:class I SAM-dependent methyltransferase n=1 Tax=Pseudodesulfovibrio sp. zrk46 TaxID=2725288 RepID=UPI00144953C1|nr:class I SAM-dependent methyltransferase [Pseudodesulfovibrio sp. zrk46]QJB55728.1 class I SAM-dependent methyltransferase [Pseudodesulfovibrio sp. zrk46]